MKKSDWAMIALNVFTTFVAFIGATERGGESVVVFMFVLVAAFVNSLWIARRDRQRAPSRTRRAATDELDAELSARELLDIDQRLEALERRDERLLRQLSAGNQLGEPAALAETAIGSERVPQRV